MNAEQRAVKDFNEKYGQPAPYGPTIPRSETRRLAITLIREEAQEAIDAIGGKIPNRHHYCPECGAVDDYELLSGETPNIVDVAKELSDVLVVTYWAATVHGIDLEPIFAEVARSNMTKEGHREDGKVLKGPNYVAPDIAGVLERQHTGHQHCEACGGGLCEMADQI